MALVRSTALALGQKLTTGRDVLFTVPPEHTVLVKTMYGYSWSTPGSSLFVNAGPAGLDYLAAAVLLPQGSWGWEGWLALDEGWQFVFSGGAGINTTYFVSGAVLPGVVGPLPGTLPA